MLTKALLRTIVYLFILLVLCWIVRLFFHTTVDASLRLSELFSYKYLKTSTLFDLKAIAIWFSPYFLLLLINSLLPVKSWSKLRLITAFILCLAFLLFSFIAVLYYPITKTIVGKDLFSMVNGQGSGIIWSYITDYWPAAIFVIIHSVLITALLQTVRLDLSKKGKLIYIPIMVICWALAARGSLSLKPLNHLDAYAALPADLAVSAMNPTFVLLESINQNQIEEFDYLSPDELKKVQEANLQTYQPILNQKPNICFILLESFGKEYTGAGSQTSYTPFLDSLSRYSVNFDQAYANGLRSMDAISAIYTGVPALMKQAFVGSLYAHIELLSAMELLKDHNYYSSFYHGADEQSMGFGAFLKAEGLDHYEGKQDYPNASHFDGHWGIYDHHYFQYFCQQLSKQSSPWFSTVFSLSSHHPYSIPEGFEWLEEGPLEIHRSIRYTDEALRLFFESAQKEKWFENTLFVITADHSSINQESTFKTVNGKYQVPLLIYSPVFFKPDSITYPVQHIDILPSLAHLFGGELFAMGRSLFDSSSRDIVHFDGGIHSIVLDSLQLSMSGNQLTGFYNQKLDPEHRFWIVDSLENQEKELKHRLKAYKQNFNSRILSNTYH